LTFYEPPRADPRLLGERLNVLPGQERLIGPKSLISPAVLKHLGFDPLDAIADDAVGQLGRCDEVGPGLANSYEHLGHHRLSRPSPFAAPRSPTRLQNWPGHISSFHRSRSGCWSRRAHVVTPSSPAQVTRTSLGSSSSTM